MITSSRFDFGLYSTERLLYLSKFVSISERIDPSNKETDTAYGNNSNSIIFNLTSHSDELN